MSWPPRIRYAALLAVVTLVPASYLAGRAARSGRCPLRQPAVDVERWRWDFGQVKAGGTLLARFTVHNAGGRRLVLNQKSPSCECILRNSKTIIIPPGGCGDLVARMKTTAIRGAVASEVQYATSDPACPLLKFTLLADVQPDQSEPAHASAALEPKPAGERQPGL